jgi:hypothetical protein
VEWWFEKFEYQVVWGLKKFVLVPECHIPNIIELFRRLPQFAPEDLKFCMELAKNLLYEIKRSINSVD